MPLLVGNEKAERITKLEAYEPADRDRYMNGIQVPTA